MRKPVIRVNRVAGTGIAAVQVWLRGGSRVESIPGQASIAGRMLAEGTRSRNWRQISLAAEERGMALSSIGGFEVLGITTEAMASEWRTALDWVLELTLEPSFPDDRCQLLVRQNLTELEALGDQPEIRAAWRFLEQLYDPHPRSRPVQGTPEGLARVSPESCVELHRQSLGREPIISVAGEIDADQVRDAIERHFRGAECEVASSVEPKPPEGSGRSREEILLPGGEQAHLILGHLTVPRAHPDFASLELLGVILGSGSGLNGRIPRRVREREGLSYSVETGLTSGAGLDPGRLFVHLGTSPELLDRAERCVREELERLVELGPDNQEVEAARSYLIGREPFRREAPHQVAELAAAAELYGLPLDDPDWVIQRWRSLDRNEVADAAKRHLLPDALRVTVGRPGPH